MVNTITMANTSVPIASVYTLPW